MEIILAITIILALIGIFIVIGNLLPTPKQYMDYRLVCPDGIRLGVHIPCVTFLTACGPISIPEDSDAELMSYFCKVADFKRSRGGIVSGTPKEYETGQRLELGPLPGASVNIQISDPINQEWVEKFHKALNDEKPETD